MVPDAYSLALYTSQAEHAGQYPGITLWLWVGILQVVQSTELGPTLLQVSDHRRCRGFITVYILVYV